MERETLEEKKKTDRNKMSGAAEGEEVRYRKWRAKREKGEERDIKATGGGGLNIPDISCSGDKAWKEPGNDSRFVRRHCIIQADIKGLEQPSAMMGRECVCEGGRKEASCLQNIV